MSLEGKVLHQGKREVVRTGADHAADGSVAEAADANASGGLQVEVRECGGVEPLGGGALGGVERYALQLIGAGLADGGENVGVGGVNRLLIWREEWAALKDRDSGQLPAA